MQCILAQNIVQAGFFLKQEEGTLEISINS